MSFFARRESLSIYSHLLSTKDQPLLHRWDSLLLFHALLYPLDFVVWLDVEFDLFTRKGTHSAREVVSKCDLVCAYLPAGREESLEMDCLLDLHLELSGYTVGRCRSARALG